jgi:hypothetical protein
MRWLIAVGLGAAPVVLAVACAGPEFTLALRSEDATAKDVDLEVGRGDESSDGKIVDVTERDASDASAIDGAGADAPDAADSMNAGDSVDVVGSDVLDAGADVPAHCSGVFECSPVVPTGWAGPFELYEGSNSAPACETGFSGSTLDGHAGLSAPAASCSCQCGAPQGLQCSSPTMTFSSTPTSCTTSCAAAILTPGVCTTVDMRTRCALGLTGAGMTVPAPAAPTQGSCAPVRIEGIAVATWATNSRGCVASVASRADCKVGSVCVPAPTSPFLAGLCIEQAGDVACPVTDYTTKYLYYAGITDTRGCSTCTCGAVSGASCAGSIDQYKSADAGCNTLQTIYDLPQTCAALQQPADLVLSLKASNGSCAPSVVSATGAATPTTPMTFCCAP